MKFHLLINLFYDNITLGYSYLKGLRWLCLHLGLVVSSGLDPENLQGQSFYQYQKAGQWQFTAGVGITKYFGELSNEKQLGDINPHLSLALNLPLQGRWSFRPEVSYYRISAADADLPDGDSRKDRNLSFRSDNLELSGLLVYGLHAKDQRMKVSRLRPYVMAGLGITYFNPRALLDGSWYSLQPLYTEGIKYKKFHLVVPLGAGLAVILNEQWKLGMEISYRLSFTDYLDDVSTNYRDPTSFPNPTAAALADRRPEIGLDKAPTGSPRGNSNTNDGYLFFGVKLFHQLPGTGPLRRKR